MAIIHGLRQIGGRPARAGRLPRAASPVRLVVASAALFAAAAAAALLASSDAHVAVRTVFVSRALGRPVADAPLTRTPAAGVHVVLGRGSFAVAHAGHRVQLVDDAAPGPWTRYAHGVARQTPFGRESVVVTRTGTEQFLSVDRHLGRRVWQWRLQSLDLASRVGSDGSVQFVHDHVLTGLAIAPPRIEDAAGRDVTPAGTSWTLRTIHGHTVLALSLDDARLPTPYVVDPAITLRGTGGYAGGSNGGATGATVLVPSGVLPGDVLVAEIALATPNVTLTAPSGWTQNGTTTNNGNGGTATGEMAIYWHKVGTSEPASYTWTWPAATTADWAASMVALVGVNATSPVAAAGSVNRTSNTAMIADSTTTIAANDLALDSYMLAEGTGSASPYYSTPAGATFLGNAQSTNATLSSRVSIAGSYSISSTGSVAGRSTTCSGCAATGRGIGWMTGWAIDSSAPTSPTLSSPGATVRGSSVTLSGSATENDSALTLVFEYTTNGGSTWTQIANVPATSGAATTTTWNTTGLADGFYDLRLVARNGAWTSADGDVASNYESVSPTVTVRVDNSSVSADALTVQALTGSAAQYYDSANHYLWYNPGSSGSSGSFTVTAAPQDVQAPIELVQTAESGGTPAGSQGTQGPVTIALATAPTVGDVMIAGISYESGSNATISPPSGWTLLDTQNLTTFWGMKVYYKVVTASDVTTHSYVWTNTASSAANLSGGILEFANVWVPASGNPIAAEASGTSTSGTTSITAPSVTPTADCEVLVNASGAWSSQESFTPPAGMTEYVDYRSNEPQWDPGVEMSAQYLGSTAATGTRVATLVPGGSTTGGDKSNAGFNLLLRPKACVSQVDFPALALTGFTATAASPTTPTGTTGIAQSPNLPAYLSNTYSWTTSNTIEPGNQPIVAHDEAGNANLSTNFYILKDTTAPSFGSNKPTAGGYYNGAFPLSVPVTALGSGSATDSGDDATAPGSTGSGVNATTFQLQRQSGTASNGTCTYSGAWSNVTLSGGNDTINAVGCYRYREAVTDNVGNTGYSSASGDVVVDHTSPSSAGTVSISTTGAGTYASGSTVYYRPAGAGGTFTVTDTSPADAESGVGKVRFPGLAGGITPSSNTDVAAPGPYSNTYTWHTNDTTSGSQTLTVYDRAGNSTTTSFAVTPDSSGPTLPAPTFPVANTSYGNTNAYSTAWSGSVSDGGAGVASVQVSLRDPNGNYWNGSAFGGTSETFATAALSGSPTSGWSWTAPSVSTNGTYTVHVVATDNVGNTTSSTFTFVYDTTAPTFGAVGITKLGNCDANVALVGTTVYYNPNVSCSAGAFAVTEPLADTGGSGPASVAYPATASGVSHSAETVTSSPWTSSAYSWTSGATLNATQTVTGKDGAGNSATTSFAIAPDSQAPTASLTAPSGSVVANGATLTATASDATTGGSGVKQVEFRYCAGATCTYAASTGIATAASSPYTTTWTSQPADGTYTILARATDNVGNTTDVTKTVTVDNTAPTFSSAALDPTGRQLTITFNEAGSGLDSTSTTPASAFTVNRNGSADTVSAVTWLSATKVKLTLAARAFDGDTVTVAYSTTSLSLAQEEKDNAGNVVASFGAQSVATSAAPSLAQTAIGASPTSVTADGSSTSTITVTLKNAAGANVGASGGTVTLATSAGSLGAVADNGNGTYTATLTAPTSAGTATVSARVDGSSIANTTSVTFTSGAVSGGTSTVASSPGSVLADGATTSTITVTAKDTFGNPVGGQTVTLAQGSGSSTISPSSATTSSSGVATFAVKDTKAETVTYAATIGLTGVVQTAQVVFTPGAATHLTVTAPGSATAGGAFAVTVRALDANNNVATGYTGTVHFTSTDAQAALPANYTFTAGDNGSHTFPAAATLKTAGSQTITATDTGNGSIAGTSGNVAVAPAGAATLLVAAATPQTAGSAFGVTVTAKDAYGNTATGYTGTVHFTSSDAQAALPANYTFAAGDNGSHSFPAAATLKTAGSQTITATDTGNGAIAGSSPAITVNPAGAATLTLTTSAANPQPAGSTFNVTVTAKDAYGNTATGYTGGIQFTSSDPAVIAGSGLPANYTFAPADGGTHTFTNVFLKTVGSRTVTATDTVLGTISGTSAPVNVGAGTAVTLAVAATTPQTAGSAFAVTVTAKDAYGNTATGYTGTVHFTSSDAQAALPANYTFAAGDNGSHSFPAAATLKTAGSQTITATDTGNGAIAGSSPAITVAPVGAATLSVTAATPQTAGSAFGVTVTAKDAYGNTATGYTGTVHFTTSDGQGAVPADYTFVAGDNGSHTFAGAVTLKTAGAQTITAADTGNGSITGTSAAITVNPGAAVRLVVSTSAGATRTAGSPFDVTVTARDAFGNTATGYTGTVRFGSGDGQAALPADYTFVAGDHGSHTFTNGASLKTAGSQTISATDTASSSITGTSGPVDVVPAAAASLTVTTDAANPQTAGAAFDVIVAARDAYGNVATGYGGTVHLGSSDPGATLPADSTLTNGTRTFTGAAFATAGAQTITATDTVSPSISGTSPTVNVGAAAAANLTVTTTAGASRTAGSPFSATVTAYDRYGNVAAGYTGTVHLTSNDAQASLPSDYTFVAGDGGTHTFAGVVYKTAGSRSLTATDTGNGSITGTSGSTVVTAAAASTLAVTTTAASPQTAGGTFQTTVTAFDAYGNVATGYAGTVHFGSTDARAVLPANYTFGGADNGTHTFSGVAYDTAGSQRITATDTATPSVMGTSAATTVAPAAAASLTVTTTAGSPQTAGGTFQAAVTAFDAYGNVATGYGGTVHFTSGDPQAVLPADATLTNGTRTFSGVAFDTAGSQTLTATDTTAPSITGTSTAVTVAPAQAASLVVTTTAASPQTAGATFQATVTAKDAFGNVATGYGGTVHFTSGDPQAVLPADATLTNGTRTFPGVAFGTAGSQTVTAADTTAPSITGTSAPVTVAAAALDHFSFALAGPQASGRPFTGVDTLTADDRYGNVVTSFDAFADHVTISANAPLTGSVSGLSGVNRLVSAGDFVNGVANLGALGMTYTGNAATGSFTATAATGQTGTSAPVTVGAGTATRLVVTGSASQTAGASQALTISAEDASGNVVTGYGGDKSLTFSGASAIGSHNPTVTDKSGAAVPFGTATTVTFTNGVATAGGSLRLYRVESATISVTDGALSSAGADRLGVSVAPATAASLQLSPSTTTPTAGSPDTLTLTALDPFGNTDTSYAGDKSLTFGGASSLGANAPTVTDMSATAQPFGTPETISFANGVATATMKLYKAETASVTVGDGTISNGAGTSFTTSAAAATQLALSVDGGSSPTANVAFPVAVTSLDQYGNVSGVASDTGVALSLATGTGTLGGTLTTTVARGRSQATFGGVTYTKAESGVKLTATRTSGDALSPVTSSPFTVGAVATRLVVTSVAGGAHPQAGQPFSITVGAEDASSNTSSVSSATSFAISLHTGTGTLAGTATGTIPAGADHVSVSGLTYTKAEGGVSVTVTVTSGDSLSAGTSAPFTVDAGPATHLVLAGPGSATAGTPFGLTVTAYDALGNVATGYTGGVHFTSSDAGAQLPADYTFAPADAGTHTFTNVALENAGSQTVTATDTVLPSITGTSGTIAVHAGAAASLALTTTAASPQAAGAAFSATVTARDAYGNVATGYTGTVHFTSSDPQHTLPADSTLTNGTGTFGGVVLGTTGTQTLTVADTSDGALTGAANVTVGPGAPNAGRSSVSASPATIPADGTTPSTITVHVRDAYGNAVTTGGAAVTLSTDHGTVSSAVDAGNGTYTGTFTTTTTQTAHVGGTINGSAIGTSATVASTPGAADGSQTQITPQYGAILADGSDHMNVTVQLRDRYGNDLTAGGQSVSLSSTLGATFGAVTDNGNGTYTAVLTAGTTSGTAQLTATVNGRAVSTTVSFQPVPVVIVVDGGTPANPTASRSVNVAFHASDSSATTQCALDGAAFAPCTSPFSASGLTEGTHTLRLRGTNGAGTGPESDLTWRIDLTGPTVSFTTAPGRYTNNPTEPLAASASDPSGVASVDFRYVPHGTPCSAAGGTDIFFDASAPYSTTWTVPADGTYDLCAVAADNLGNTSVATTTVVADQTAPTGTFPAVGTLVGSTRYIGGDVPLHVTASDATSGVAQVALAYAGTSSGTIGTVASAPYDATWHAGGLADGPYTLHATIGDKASNSATLTQDVVVDNTAPTASLDDPGAYGHGTIHLSVTASDTGSGVDTAAIQIQSSPHGAGTWTTIGTGVAVAWTPTPDGAYDLRALVPDNVGNQTTTATRTIVVDNTPPTVFDDSDSSWHRTPVTLHVTAADAQSGIASVTYELDGGSTQTGTTVAVPATDGVHTITYHATNGAGLTTSGTATVKFDATPPSQVTLDAPANGALLRGTVTLSASATDATSGIASTTFHVARAGTLGANDCATFGQTITSPLDTTTLADGQYDLWVAAADQAGNGRCSVTSGPGSISVTIDNTAPVTTDDAPAGPQNHDVLVHLAATDNLTGVASTEYSLDGGPWTPGTTVSVLAPADHSDDGSHTIQYRSTDGAGNVETVKTTHVVIDTTAPAGGVDDPGSYLSGTVDLTASPTDSDVASVAFLYRPAGGSGPWTSIGTDTSAPYDVPWITTAVPDGRYDLEEVVTDTAGNSNTVPMSTKTVDNTAPDTAAVTAPAAGADTGGTVAFAASASDATSGVKTVTFEVEATGQSGFTTVDADTNGAPYTGTWNSTGVPDGPAQVRVVVTDFAGNSTTSAPVSFIVDNTAPTVSLQAPPAAAASASLSATGSADIDHVDYEWSGDGTTWHSIGTSSSPPYSTTWTTPAADGTYQVRARATDHGGNVSPYDVKTVVVDHTAPTASALLPADGDTVGGSSVPLSVTASDGGSGVASVTFLYRPSGGGAWTGIAAPAGAPYTGTWDVHSLPSGDYDVEAVVLDGAGNATTIVHTVHVDSTPPTLSAFPVGSPVHGTITLQVTTSADTAGATYGVAPSGGGAWTQVASSSTGPTFSAPFDTTTLADGTYDFRATVADRFRNATTLDVPVVVDNTPPSVVASTPADGSVVPSAGSLSLTASEPVASVDDLQLDGANARFTPSISGADVTFPTGALPPGNHALTGWLHDAAGNSAPFRINVTVRDTSAAALPPVAKNVSSSADTVLTSADGTASVTTHHDVWQQAIPQPQDFLVLHIDPMPASLISPGAGAQIAGPVEDVRMTWDLAGTEEHHFDDPIEIDLADPTGSGTPATAEVTTSWRAIPQLQTAGTLPAGQQDGYWRTGSTVHILTRHLSLFTILTTLTSSAVAPPIEFSGTVGFDGLTLRWAPGIPTVQSFALYADGAVVGRFGGTTYEAKLGQITSDDTRTFTITETSTAGAESAPSQALRVVPAVAGDSQAQAAAALAGRGFTVGNLVPVAAVGEPAGTVVGPTDVQVLPVGSPVDLQVASGGAAHSPFAFTVAAAPRLRAVAGTLYARVAVTASARIDVTLDANPWNRLQRWHFFHVAPGATIVKLRLRAPLQPGDYRLFWKATSLSDHSVSRRITPLRILAKKARAHGTPNQVLVLAGARSLASARPANARLSRVTPEQAYLFATYHDVSVVVVDTALYGAQLARNLHTVFPNTAVVALARSPYTRTSLARGGCVAVPASTTTKQLVALIDRLDSKP